MTELVERLLDVSRVAQRKLALNPEETDLAALTGQVVDDFREAAAVVGSELRFDSIGSAVGCWDKARIEQVIVNLVSNAIKYGGGKAVDIRVDGTDTGARVTVADRGIGIAAEDVERIFGRFERAAPLRHYGGLGVGLYITRSIVEAHGGAIRVSSTLGQGATFVVELSKRPALAQHARSDRLESTT
jgi:signal transduction histidine kinase